MKRQSYRALVKGGAVLAFAMVLGVAGCVIRPTRPGVRIMAVPPPTQVVATAPVVAQPAVAASGQVASGMISYPQERLRFQLPVSYARTVNIYVQGHGLDPTVAVYDPYGNRLGFNDDGGSGLDSRLVVTLAPGSYAVEVAGYSSSTGSFTLTIN